MVSDGKTYSDIGVHFGISRERVRQIAEKIGAASVRRWHRKESAAVRLRTLRDANKTASKTGLTLARLRELLEYDRFTGRWFWRGAACKRAGTLAGTLHQFGYVQIRVDGKLYMAHVLAWFYSFECWPKNEIDHVNGRPSDNRLNNLRQATPMQNQGNRPASKNNTSGFKGVWKNGNRWVAEVAHVRLGSFNTPEEAAAKVAEASKIRYGEFACLALDARQR
jgi:hypothetical protein